MEITGTDTTERTANRDWALFAIAILVIVLDQATKYMVRLNFTPGQSFPENWPVRLTFYTNTGAAFGLFPDQTVLFAIVAIAAIALIVFYHRQLPKDGVIIHIGLGLQLGGAIGNLIDRLVLGRVTDFIDVGFWPVFNFADSSIVIGVCLLAYYLLFSAPKQPEPVTVDTADKPQEQ